MTRPGCDRTGCSSVYETEPWAVADQPNFLNLVAGYETTLSSGGPAGGVQVRGGGGWSRRLATAGGRDSSTWTSCSTATKVVRFGASRILQIPHPRMMQRAFVLVPLAEIAPDTGVPPQGDTVRRLLDEVDDRAGVVLWGNIPPA